MASPKQSKEVDVAPATIVRSDRELATRLYVSDLIDRRNLWADSSGLIDDILNADSLEKALKTFNSTPAEQILGHALEVHDVRFLPSQYDNEEGGIGVFALIRAVDTETGELLTVSTGGATICATLLKAQSEGWLPAQFRITKAEKTSRGYQPLNLEAVESF